MEVGQKIVWEPIAGVDPLKIDPAQSLAGYRGIATLGIHDVGVSGGRAGQHGQRQVSDQSQPRHGANNRGVEETVPFDIVGISSRDGFQQAGEICGIHLPVSGHYDCNLQVLPHRFAIARDDGTAHPPIGGMTHDDCAAVRDGPGNIGSCIPTGIINNEDAVDECGDGP